MPCHHTSARGVKAWPTATCHGHEEQSGARGGPRWILPPTVLGGTADGSTRQARLVRAYGADILSCPSSFASRLRTRKAVKAKLQPATSVSSRARCAPGSPFSLPKSCFGSASRSPSWVVIRPRKALTSAGNAEPNKAQADQGQPLGPGQVMVCVSVLGQRRSPSSFALPPSLASPTR